MNPQAFIFIGRSGCGKGTQIELLEKVLKEKDSVNEVLYIYSGQELRKFKEGPTVTAQMAKTLYDSGNLMPEFLVINMWVMPLVEKYKGNQHLIFDGTPRKFHEAGVLHSAFSFYGFEKPWVINLDITGEEAVRRLSVRGRQDDNEADVRKRLAWYETDVVPTINYYVNNPAYNFLKIDANRKIEEVHADIVKKLGLV